MNSKTIPYLYKWIQKSTGKYYIGSKTQEFWNPEMHETYVCSSKIVKPLILENRKDWEYTILVIGEKKYIRKLETELLSILDAKNDPMSYNRSNAKFDPGNRLGTFDSGETRKRKSIARIGDKNPMFGKTGELSPHWNKSYSETRKKNQSIGVSRYAKNRPDAHNKNISKALKGNPKLGLKGDKNPSYSNPLVSAHLNRIPPELCEYCGKTVSIGNYVRWHGDNCKLKPDLTPG